MPSEESKAASVDKPLIPEAPANPTSSPAHKRRRWPLILGVIVAVALIFVGIPQIIHALNTVSTDDAYVNGHVTFVAARVIGQVARVLVDDNYRIKTGDVLVELDPEPYQVQVAINQAIVNSRLHSGAVASAECDRQLRESGAALASPDRRDELRS